MDCCNYGGYRAPAAGAWDGYAPYAPPAYYAPGYYAHGHDPYARYYRYDYPPPHAHHSDHVMPMDYGAYASKEVRMRRALARREARAHTPAHHMPLPPTPPLECGMNVRGPAYCEPQMWSHYQMELMGSNGWNNGSAVNGSWANRGSCSREVMRYFSDCRPIKSPHLHPHNQMCTQDGRSTPYPVYEETPLSGDIVPRQGNSSEFPVSNVAAQDVARNAQDRFYTEPRRSPPEEKRPPVVPLPAFQQAFGSTEIGKFAEAFSRTEVGIEDNSGESFSFESFTDWDGPPEPQWPAQQASREIKCEDNY